MSDISKTREAWEAEIFAGHRWGRFGERANAESSRLKVLWDVIQPVDDNIRKIIDQIASLEICNWRLKDSIVALCQAIAQKKPTEMPIGHGASMTEKRWQQVWAYYLSLRDWLAVDNNVSCFVLLKTCDPEAKIKKHITDMLGEKTELKELYIERLCLSLERWFFAHQPWESVMLKGHRAAAEAIEAEIKSRDPENHILSAMHQDGDERLIPCNHKAFRRYDIIISSIGCGKWRGAMPMRGTDGFERAEILASYLDPIEAWIEKQQKASCDSEPGIRILELLGEPDNQKIFLASLLVSLLRSHELTARQLAERRQGKSNN